MRITKFTIAIIFISLMFLVKLYFFKLEPAYATSVVGTIDIISYSLLFMGGIIFFMFEKKRRIVVPNKKGKRDAKITIFLFAISLVVIIISSYVNLSKGAIEWDAIALYDARAKFLSQGMNFSEMVSLSKFDDKNQYYYLLYPPYTSIVHRFWHEHVSIAPISFYYSLNLILLGLGIFLLTKERLGVLFAALLMFLSIANTNIFYTSIIEYTNLPFTLYIIFGFFLILHFIESKEKWSLFFGTVLIGTSQFIRFLEPIWIAVVIAFFLTALVKRKNKTISLSIVVLFVFCALQYYSWQFFVGSIADNPQIFDFSHITIIEGILGIFTGGLFKVTLYLIRSWGLTLLVYLVSLINIGRRKKLADIFAGWVIIFSILFYWGSLYLISLEYDWWVEMGESLMRSSTYLLPISAYLLLKNVKIILGETRTGLGKRKIGFSEIIKRAFVRS
ncbi:hypothetical protein KKH23_02225 [Patescibacteria group bacterium]|nr:hypothetical protein [Patescibacteria group bacterium]MBU0777371.1 hypothetical protein [Patescibacteria group bacterium]MBU0845999.1 hypothetical protein [Patescibacteria group bacterium]MBU0922548.1 hypothetical protein [Patescibacteria group bacterium]MBU1066519.1 hypothetical protein [Patescibacteria group bacterium]